MSTHQDFKTPKVEILGGLLLLGATILALALANSPWSRGFADLWDTDLKLGWGSLAIEMSLAHWVNDALMAVFFFAVGIEIKQELVLGQLAHVKNALLPVGAAFGGVIVPAAIYFAFNAGGPGVHGWGIPMATDIAFAMGLIALAGSWVPPSLKVTLLALAVVDDILAIVVIAVFYSEGISLMWLAAAVGGLCLVVVMKRLGVSGIPWYLLVGTAVWYATFRSGIHATIAGVALGLLTPVVAKRPEGQSDGVVFEEFEVIDQKSVAQRLENVLTPLSSFIVIPIFALANAGITLGSQAISNAISSPVTAGIFFGLVIGKVTGVTLAVGLMTRLRVASLPDGLTMAHIVAMGLAAGIGFTVSLFITGLAFENPVLVLDAKTGILAASIVSAGIGLAAFWGISTRSKALNAAIIAD